MCYTDQVKNITLILTALFLVSCAHIVNQAKDQEKSKLLLQLAADQLNQRDFQKAIENTLESIKFDPKYAAAYNHLALIYMETKRYQKSEDNFKKALEIDPNYSEVYNNYGVLLNRLERYSEAIPMFEKALSFDMYPTPENALTNMGYTYYKMGNLAKSKTFHQRALDLVPQFCLAHKNFGDVYTKEKNYQKASDYFEKASTYCPLYQEAQYKQALVMMKMGKKNVAKNHFEKLIEKHKSGHFVDKSQEVLKFLKK
jgi:type IV pilus biogenesis/stability protein PilW